MSLSLATRLNVIKSVVITREMTRKNATMETIFQEMDAQMLV